LSGPQELVVIGGGEHARVLLEAALSRPEAWTVLGFVDPSPCEETRDRLSVPRLGDDDDGLRRTGPARFAIGVGSTGPSERRRRIAARYDAAGARWATVIHATAWVSPSARLAEGVFVSAGASVNSGAVVGRHAVVNTGAVVEHDVVIGEFAQVGPAAAIGGGARIGDGSYVGLGARVRDHVAVGARATVGMGAAVIVAVTDDEIVVGVPAAPLRRRG
jgi:acetyltransferase EpsM